MGPGPSLTIGGRDSGSTHSCSDISEPSSKQDQHCSIQGAASWPWGATTRRGGHSTGTARAGPLGVQGKSSQHPSLGWQKRGLGKMVEEGFSWNQGEGALLLSLKETPCPVYTVLSQLHSEKETNPLAPAVSCKCSPPLPAPPPALPRAGTCFPAYLCPCPQPRARDGGGSREMDPRTDPRSLQGRRQDPPGFPGGGVFCLLPKCTINPSEIHRHHQKAPAGLAPSNQRLLPLLPTRLHVQGVLHPHLLGGHFF